MTMKSYFFVLPNIILIIKSVMHNLWCMFQINYAHFGGFQALKKRDRYLWLTFIYKREIQPY